MINRETAQEVLNQLPGQLEEPRLLLVGVGGAGINMLRTMDADVEFDMAAIDTDDYALALSGVEDQLHLPVTADGGTGGDPGIGREVALRHREEIKELLTADILFLMAGLGRGTGTGVSPVVAELARERGLSVLAFLAWPFRREDLAQTAGRGLQALRAFTDGVLVLDNESAREFPGIGARSGAAQLVNEMLGRVLLDLCDHVHDAFPFSVQEEMADFLSGLPKGKAGLPVRATAWASKRAAEPLSTDPRGAVRVR